MNARLDHFQSAEIIVSAVHTCYIFTDLSTLIAHKKIRYRTYNSSLSRAHRVS